MVLLEENSGDFYDVFRIYPLWTISVQNVVQFYLVDIKISYKINYGWISPFQLVAIQG